MIIILKLNAIFYISHFPKSFLLLSENLIINIYISHTISSYYYIFYKIKKKLIEKLKIGVLFQNNLPSWKHFTYISKIDVLMRETDRLTFFEFFLSSKITNDNLSSYLIILYPILSSYTKQCFTYISKIRHHILLYPLRYFYFK